MWLREATSDNLFRPQASRRAPHLGASHQDKDTPPPNCLWCSSHANHFGAVSKVLSMTSGVARASGFPAFMTTAMIPSSSAEERTARSTAHGTCQYGGKGQGRARAGSSELSNLAEPYYVGMMALNVLGRRASLSSPMGPRVIKLRFSLRASTQLVKFAGQNPRNPTPLKTPAILHTEVQEIICSCRKIQRGFGPGFFSCGRWRQAEAPHFLLPPSWPLAHSSWFLRARTKT